MTRQEEVKAKTKSELFVSVKGPFQENSFSTS